MHRGILTRHSEIVELQNDLLNTMASYRDLYITRTALETQSPVREALTLHALNHITKYVAFLHIFFTLTDNIPQKTPPHPQEQ